jgi:hypothetical protein
LTVLRTYEGDPHAVKVEATLEDCAWKRRVTEAAPLLAEEVKRAEPDGGVLVVGHFARYDSAGRLIP